MTRAALFVALMTTSVARAQTADPGVAVDRFVPAVGPTALVGRGIATFAVSAMTPGNSNHMSENPAESQTNVTSGLRRANSATASTSD